MDGKCVHVCICMYFVSISFVCLLVCPSFGRLGVWLFICVYVCVCLYIHMIVVVCSCMYACIYVECFCIFTCMFV